MHFCSTKVFSVFKIDCSKLSVQTPYKLYNENLLKENFNILLFAMNLEVHLTGKIYFSNYTEQFGIFLFAHI